MVLQLSQKNPHYLEFRGKPIVLIGSGEHYGAVLNQEFDYLTYLDEIARAGLNLTRLFSGTYREIPGSFQIKHNTLAPRRGAYVCPWAQAGSGAGAGEEVYDLKRYSADYFARLKDFLREAERRDVIVELVLFCFYYTDQLWQNSPLWIGNNVNGVGDCSRLQVYRIDKTKLLEFQKKLVQKLAGELNGFDNLYYEIINEPYVLFNGESFLGWQNCMIDALVQAESKLPKKHLIAQNIYNRTFHVESLHPAVSILNFHYALPSAAGANYHLNRPIADDETGFAGQEPLPYRREAWRFMLCGGAIVSHLDYSYTTDHPDGTESDLDQTPGCGGPEMRRQLLVLREFIERFDFVALKPHDEIILNLAYNPNVQIHALGNPGKEYAVYITGGEEVTTELGIPEGTYQVEWIDTVNGALIRRETMNAMSGHAAQNRLVSPRFAEDIALRIVRAKS